MLCLICGLTLQLSGKNFVKFSQIIKIVYNIFYRNPTPSGQSLTKWEPATKYPWHFVRIGTQDPKNWYILQNEESYAQDRFAFWSNFNIHVGVDSKIGKDEL